MADSIPSLRIKLDAALAELDALRTSMREPASRIVYVDNPDLINTINMLKEKLCKSESSDQQRSIAE